jgi:GT2 family glycosyltransferase
MFLRTETLKKVGFFDDDIFMYLEDADLTRRFNESKNIN